MSHHSFRFRHLSYEDGLLYRAGALRLAVWRAPFSTEAFWFEAAQILLTPCGPRSDWIDCGCVNEMYTRFSKREADCGQMLGSHIIAGKGLVNHFAGEIATLAGQPQQFGHSLGDIETGLGFEGSG